MDKQEHMLVQLDSKVRATGTELKKKAIPLLSAGCDFDMRVTKLFSQPLLVVH